MAAHNSANNTVSVQTTFPEGMGGARYDPDRHGYRIYVGNLPHDTCHDDLARLFLTFGPIVDIWLASNPPGFGFVVFKNAADAETAVLGKNCTVFRGMIMKVQHARMFKDRFIKPFHKGRRSATGSDTSRSRSRSRSLSRSSRSRSRSSSRLRQISKIYGSSRTRSRSPLRLDSKSRSRSRSKSRSSSSPLTSMSDSSSRSRSRSVPRHGYSSSEGSDGKRSSSKSRHNRRHRRHRSTRQRSSLQRKIPSSAVAEKTRYSNTRSHSASSSPQYSRSSSRSDISSAHDDEKRHHHHRHTRRSSSPCHSASSQSPSSANDGKDSPTKVTRKSRRKRKRKRSHRPKRDSSSSLSSASSSSSSSSSSSPDPGRRRKKGRASAEAQSSLSRQIPSALVQEDEVEPPLPVTTNHHTSTAMSPPNSISPRLPSASTPVISPAHTGLSNSTIPDTESSFSAFGACPETTAVVDPVTCTVDPSFRPASVQKPLSDMPSLSPLNTCQTCAQPEENAAALCEFSLSCESVFPSVGNVSVTTSTVAPYRAALQNSSSDSALTGPKLTVESGCVGTTNHPIPTSASVLDTQTLRSSMPTFSSNSLSSLQSPGRSQASDHTVTRLITSIALRHPSSSIAISECLSVMAAALNMPDTTSVQLNTTSTSTSADRIVSTAPTQQSQFPQDQQCGCQHHTKQAVPACYSAPADCERTAGKEGSGTVCGDDGSGRHSVSPSTVKGTAGGALLQHFDFYPGTFSDSVHSAVKENPMESSTKHSEFQVLDRQPCSLRASRTAPVWATGTEQDDLVNISENHVELTKNCTRKMPITGYDYVNDDAMMEKETLDIPTLSDSGSNYRENGIDQQNIKTPKTTLATKNACEEKSPQESGNHTQLPASFTGFSIEKRKPADMKHEKAVSEKQDNPPFIPRQNYEQTQHSAQHISENTKIFDKEQFFTEPWISPSSQVSKPCTQNNATQKPCVWEPANMDDCSYQLTPGFHSAYEHNSLHTANRRQKMQIKLHSTVLPSVNDRLQPGARESDRQTADSDFQIRKGETDDPIQRHAPYYRSKRQTSPTRRGLPENVAPACSSSENRRNTPRIKRQQSAHTSGTNHLHRNYRHSSDVGSEEAAFDKDRSKWTSASYAKDITYVENHRRRWSGESSDSSTESKSRERNDSRTKAKSKSQDHLKRGFRPAETEDRNHNSRNGS